MIRGVAVLVFCIVPTGDVVEDRVDRIELNHYFAHDGSKVFTQIIFSDWDGSRFQVRAWRLVRDDSQRPIYRHDLKEYESVWEDGECLRRVRSRSFCETWTQVDPEMRERGVLPRCKRRSLTPHKYGKSVLIRTN